MRGKPTTPERKHNPSGYEPHQGTNRKLRKSAASARLSPKNRSEALCLSKDFCGRPKCPCALPLKNDSAKAPGCRPKLSVPVLSPLVGRFGLYILALFAAYLSEAQVSAANEKGSIRLRDTLTTCHLFCRN